mgnify:FL=1
MNINKRAICAFSTMALCMGAMAQSGTNSPYSQYGLGVMSDQTAGFNRGMNGLGLGFREHNQVNFLNPASYSAVDSLTFIFDVGFSGQLTNFKENGTKKNAKNADFEYAVASFRACKNLGVSFGILPYTNIGYSYSNTGKISGDATNIYSNTFYGEGGLHQVYLGAGWQILNGLSVGANFGYLWGDYTKSVTNAYSDSYVKTITKIYTANVTNYKIDFGAQYQFKAGKHDDITLGATYSIGHKLGATPECKVIATNPATALADTVAYSVKNGLEIPTSISGGIMWNHNDKLKLGVDYNFQKWGSVKYPVYSETNGTTPTYALSDQYYMDRHKVTAGGEYCGDELSRSFLKRLRIRAGVSYATPYYKINGQDGPSELSASVGFGIPIINSYNNRSILNISGQWVRSSAKNFITENTFRINIGLTFNERWFMKWKVE